MNRDDIREQAFSRAQLAIYHSSPAEWSDAQIVMTPADLIRFVDMYIEEERLVIAAMARNWCLVPPDGGSPTQEEADLCASLADAILARKEVT